MFMNKLLIIDGNSIINRAFYALPLLSNSRGEYSNAVYGFVNILTKAILDLKPTHIAVAFDYGKKTFRHKIFSDYKGTRKGMPEELACQMPMLKNLLSVMGIKYFEKSEIEADDIIGTLSQLPDEKYLLSGDRDLFQLINSSTKIWFPKKGVSEIEVIDENHLFEIMGLSPAQIVDYKALRGDSSDNIPGVAGIGEKGAIDLIKKFGTLENIYKNIDQIQGKLKEKLENGKDMAFLSKQLATIKCDVDLSYTLDELQTKFPYSNKVYEIFKDYEFKSLIKRKDIFGEEVSKLHENENLSYEKVVIDNFDQLEKIMSYIKEMQQIAFNFSDKFEFCCSPNVVYSFNQEISMFSNSISLESGLEKLKSIFENRLIKKVCFDSKKQMHSLGKYGIYMFGEIFDISIAKYLLGETLKDEFCPTFFFFLERELSQKLKENDMFDLYNKIEIPLSRVLYEMENDGLKVDTNELLFIKNELEKNLEEIVKKVNLLAGIEFNLNSPKQLSNILFNVLGLHAKNNTKLSTNVEILEQIRDQHPIIEEILKYRKIQKLLSTYVEAFYTLATNGDGYIRTVFNQTLTATGRLSSSDPNLQNLPIRDEEGKKLRKIFVSRFEDGEIVSADYNQIELRLMAHYSQDPTLLASYSRGEDIHSRTASSIFAVPLDQVTPLQRRLAKTVNFGIIYGISEYGLSVSLGTSVKNASEYMKKYFEQFPRVKQYMNESIALAEQNGFAKTLFGRRRQIPELSAPNGQIRKFGQRVAINMPLQGTASDIIKLAMIKVSDEIKQKNMKSKLVLQIHDELVVDCPASEVKEIEIMLKNIMENVVKLSVSLPVEVSSGKTLYECK